MENEMFGRQVPKRYFNGAEELTAEQARARTASAIEKKIRDEKLRVMTAINAACSNGLFEVYYNDTISPEVVSNLKEMGYAMTSEDDKIKISWRSGKK